MNKSLLPLLLVLLTALWLGGCSESPNDSSNTNPTNLVDEFGGYTSSTEKPGFDDSELLADDELEVEVEDPLLGSPEITALTSDPESGLFHFRAVWGQIPLDTTATEVIDWSGSLTISRGAELIRRVIRFEPNQDYILERTDRKTIEWVSKTTIHNDGIAVDLLIPPIEFEFDSTIVIDIDAQGDTVITYLVDTIPLEPVTVTFTSGPYSQTFTLPEIAALDKVVELENGTTIAFHAMQIFRVPCPGGFVIGRWGYDEEGNGRFRGRWMSDRGYITGWLNGHFGVDDEGHRKLFGKWINKNGQCEGFIVGTYEPTRFRCNNPDLVTRCGGGSFNGRVFDAERNPIGNLRGQYQNAPEGKGGFFQGRWRVDCQRDHDYDRGHVRDYDDGMGC